MYNEYLDAVSAAGTARERPGSRVPGRPGPAGRPDALRPRPRGRGGGGPTEGDLGVGRAVPHGAGRWTVTFTIVDARHAVWQTEMDGPGLRVVNTQRVRYELGDGELTLTTLDRFSGEEPLELREGDKKPRVYKAVWSERGRSAGARGRLEDGPGPPARPGPAHPARRSVGTRGRARGPAQAAGQADQGARLPDQVALSGARVRPGGGGPGLARPRRRLLYVDRNGNGDLTDDWEPVRSLPTPAAPGGDVTRLFDVGRLADPGRKAEYTELLVTTLTTRTGVTVAAVKGRVGRGHYQRVGPTDRPRPPPGPGRGARSSTSTGRRRLLRPVLGLEAPGRELTEFRVELGYPGVGPGSFAVRSVEEFPRGVNPVVAFEFPNADPERPPHAPRQTRIAARRWSARGRCA